MSVVRRALFNLAGRFPCRFINRNPEERYLERYYLGKCLGLTFYLHRFVSPDGDEEVHDHPWGWAASLILAGGYTEERMTRLCVADGWKSKRVKLWPGRLNIIRGHDFHRIEASKPETWTLFMHTPRSQTWGFLCADGGATRYYQPLDTKQTEHWHLTAPLGREVNRAPLGVAL